MKFLSKNFSCFSKSWKEVMAKENNLLNILQQIFYTGTPEETLKRIFMIFDVDRNDVIDKKELR